MSVDDDIVNINYNTGTYGTGAAPDFYTAFGPTIRVSDTLLAYELSNRAESAVHGGELTYLGKPHETITFEIPNSPPLKLFVDATTGYISMMQRETGFGPLTYYFSDFQRTSGVTYASSFEFFVGSEVNNVTLSRNVTINKVKNSTFNIDRGMTEAAAQIDTSEMTVNEISDNAHLVGTGIAYTLFVDTGAEIIAVGGYAGLADRFTAYKETAGHDKPLAYQIVTHHHTDHLGGMGNALALGATFITPENAIANIRTAAVDVIPDDRIVIIDNEMDLGPVKIFDIATSHAASYALVYVPAANAVFQADHYNGNFADAVAPARIGGVTFKKAVDALDIDVSTLLSAHGPRAVPWSEFETAVTDFDPAPCKSNRPICRQ